MKDERKSSRCCLFAVVSTTADKDPSSLNLDWLKNSLLGLANWLASNLFRQAAEGGMAYSHRVSDHIATAGYVA